MAYLFIMGSGNGYGSMDFSAFGLVVQVSKYRGTLQEKVATAFGRRKIDFSYETEAHKYIVTKIFKPEFVFKNSQGRAINVMVYTNLTDADREMLEIVKDQTMLEIKIIFTNACAKIPGTKMSYGEWADSQGIDWYMAHTISQIGKILKQWHNE